MHSGPGKKNKNKKNASSIIHLLSDHLHAFFDGPSKLSTPLQLEGRKHPTETSFSDRHPGDRPARCWWTPGVQIVWAIAGWTNKYGISTKIRNL